MPDELLIEMEDEIINRFMECLKPMVFADDRLDKASAFFAVDDVNKAKHKYNRMYKKG